MAIALEFMLETSADAVWAVVGDPGRVDWVPGVASATFDGHVRRFVMTGAGDLAERILLRDDAARRLEYGVIESAAPLTSHRAAITVFPAGDHARMVWETTVEPVQIEPFIRKQMEGAIVGLRRVLGLA
jgi:hypothetical protein